MNAHVSYSEGTFVYLDSHINKHGGKTEIPCLSRNKTKDGEKQNVKKKNVKRTNDRLSHTSWTSWDRIINLIGLKRGKTNPQKGNNNNNTNETVTGAFILKEAALTII